MHPERIQLRRTLGWRLPANARSVTRPGRWGNPFGLVTGFGRDHPLRAIVEESVLDVTGGHIDFSLAVHDVIYPVTRAVAVAAYRRWLLSQPGLVVEARKALRGKDLACVCPLPEPGQPDICHAAVLLDIANSCGKVAIVGGRRFPCLSHENGQHHFVAHLPACPAPFCKLPPGHRELHDIPAGRAEVVEDDSA